MHSERVVHVKGTDVPVSQFDRLYTKTMTTETTKNLAGNIVRAKSAISGPSANFTTTGNCDISSKTDEKMRQPAQLLASTPSKMPEKPHPRTAFFICPKICKSGCNHLLTYR